jgi:hypothetical protein
MLKGGLSVLTDANDHREDRFASECGMVKKFVCNRDHLSRTSLMSIPVRLRLRALSSGESSPSRRSGVRADDASACEVSPRSNWPPNGVVGALPAGGRGCT